METKRCGTCKITKSLDCFGNNKRKKDGLQGYCRSCASEAKRKWKERNPEKYRASYGSEQDRARSAAWRQANPEKARAGVRRWVEANKERKAQADARYRTRPDVVVREKQRGRLRSSQRRAQYRTHLQYTDTQALADFWEACPEGYHVDHIVPLNGELVSGLNVPWNLQYLPAEENLRKGNKWDPWEDSKELPPTNI